MMWWFHDGGAWWVLMPVLMLAFWGLVIWGVVTVVRIAERGQPPSGGTSDPERILGERYARGEIDTSEYQQRLATLRDRTHTAA